MRSCPPRSRREPPAAQRRPRQRRASESTADGIDGASVRVTPRSESARRRRNSNSGALAIPSTKRWRDTPPPSPLASRSRHRGHTHLANDSPPCSSKTCTTRHSNKPRARHRRWSHRRHPCTRSAARRPDLPARTPQFPLSCRPDSHLRSPGSLHYSRHQR